jgi:chemotaxis response regulator CheB
VLARPTDVVLMDVRMPTMDCIEATRQLATQTDPPRILILTTFDLDEYVYDALRAGASGFLLKDVTAERLFDAVRVIAAGDALLAPNVTRHLISEFAQRRPTTITTRIIRTRCTPEHATDVCLYGFFGDDEPGCHFGVGEAFGEEFEDFGLARGKNSHSATAPKRSSSPTKRDS